jgi:hypothetical protein
MEGRFNFFNDRRFVPVFFVTIVILIVTIMLADRSSHEFQKEDLVYAGLGIGAVVLGLVWREVRWRRNQRRNRYKSSPLSRDELRKARSKLSGTSHKPYKRT